MNGTPIYSARIRELLRRAGAPSGEADRLNRAAAQNPALAQALERLTDEDMARISAVLHDRDAAGRILATPQAQALLHKLKE